MTMDLLQTAHERRSLASMLARQRGAIESLARRGFVGDSAQQTVEMAQETTFGNEFSEANQIITSDESGNTAVVSIPEKSAFVRKSGSIVAETATANRFMRANALTGSLGFGTVTGLLTVAPGLIYNLAFSADDFGGSTATYAISGNHVGAWFAVSSGGAFDATVKLPDPLVSGKTIFVGDPFGVIDGTHRFKLTTFASSINGALSFPSSGWITSTYRMLLLMYHAPTSAWSCRTLN